MNKEQLLNRLQQNWKVFLKSLEGLPASALLEPDVVGHWSVRDVMGHITTWEEEKMKIIPLILKGKPIHRRYTVDAFNAREQERKQHLTLEQVQQELAATHERLAVFLADLPEDAYTSGSRLLRTLRLTCNHYLEHAAQITAWRQQCKL